MGSLWRLKMTAEAAKAEQSLAVYLTKQIFVGMGSNAFPGCPSVSNVKQKLSWIS